MTNSLLLKMAIEIVDLLINSMVIFHSYVNVYQRVYENFMNHPCLGHFGWVGNFFAAKNASPKYFQNGFILRIRWPCGPYWAKRLSAWWFGTFGLFFHLLGMSSSQQTIRPSFFRGVAQNHQAVVKQWDLVGPSSSRSDDSTTLDGHSDHSIDWWSSPCGHRDSARWTFHHLWSLWEVLGCWDFPAPQMGMGQYLYIFLVGWTSIYQLFWGSLGTRVLTHPQM